MYGPNDKKVGHFGYGVLDKECSCGVTGRCGGHDGAAAMKTRSVQLSSSTTQVSKSASLILMNHYYYYHHRFSEIKSRLTKIRLQIEKS